MRRFKYIMLALGLLLVSGGCSASVAEPVQKDGISVITTIFPPYDFVRELASDTVNVRMLLPPGAESHSFEPTPQDIIDIGECDLFIYGGGESDAWVADILDSMGDGAPESLSLMDCVEPVAEEHVEGMEHHDSGHDEENEFDEHVWASPKNAMLICDRIAEKLSELDTANSEKYAAGNSAYQARLEELDGLFEDILAASARSTIVVGDRFPFRYLADAYGIEYYAAFPGCSTESEPSAATVAFLIDKVNELELPAVFYIEFSNHLVADTIAEATGAQPLLLHSCHSVTASELESGASYISLMTQNAENLRKALN